MAQALVPLKDLVQAKSRLAGLLRPSERRALAQAMVEDVLAVLSSHPQISRVTLVSDDPGAGLLAAQYGIRYWPESALPCRGLNAVITCASELLAADCEEPLLVLHGDLPLITAADITAVLARHGELGGLVIGCDRRGAGTNLLAFSSGRAPEFCFGADSCNRHREAARAAGMPVAVIRRPGIGLDVDEAADLAAVLARLTADPERAAVGVHTGQLLYATGLGARVQLALASLTVDMGPPNEEQAN